MQEPVSFYPAIFSSISFSPAIFFFSLTSCSHINDVYGVKAPKTHFFKKTVLGENIRFSLLFATGDVSRGETSFLLAKRRQQRRARRNGFFRMLSSEWRFSVKTPTSRLRLDGRKRMEYDFGDHILLLLRMFCGGCYLTIVLLAFWCFDVDGRKRFSVFAFFWKRKKKSQFQNFPDTCWHDLKCKGWK